MAEVRKPFGSFLPDQNVTAPQLSPQPMLSGALNVDMPQDYSADIEQVGRKYPGLRPYIDKLAVTRGTPSGPGDDRQLEFYQPWERDNPNPGKLTAEIFSPLNGDDLHQAIAGDMLHHLGTVNPTTGKPVDQTFFDLKQQLGAARSPKHLDIDRRAYEQEKASPYGAGEYGDWDQNNRLDAYVRGGLFPAQNPEWQGGVLSPEMQPIISKMRDYLGTAQ